MTKVNKYASHSKAEEAKKRIDEKHDSWLDALKKKSEKLRKDASKNKQKPQPKTSKKKPQPKKKNNAQQKVKKVNQVPSFLNKDNKKKVQQVNEEVKINKEPHSIQMDIQVYEKFIKIKGSLCFHRKDKALGYWFSAFTTNIELLIDKNKITITDYLFFNKNKRNHTYKPQTAEQGYLKKELEKLILRNGVLSKSKGIDDFINMLNRKVNKVWNSIHKDTTKPYKEVILPHLVKLKSQPDI